MGSFANSMFIVLLDWFKGAVELLWNALFNAEEGGAIEWIGQHWLGLVIALSLACMLVDLLVHLLRWQPHKVWARFFRRIRGKSDAMQDTGGYAARMRREWHYADGTARSEEIIGQAQAAAAQIKSKASADIEMEKKKAINDAKDEISGMAMAIAEKVVGRELTVADQADLIDGFIAQLGG